MRKEAKLTKEKPYDEELNDLLDKFDTGSGGFRVDTIKDSIIERHVEKERGEYYKEYYEYISDYEDDLYFSHRKK